MARKRATTTAGPRVLSRKRGLPSGPKRVVSITLPLETAKRLDRIAVDRDAASPSVVVWDLIERCPIRGAGSSEPAAGNSEPV